MKQIKTSGIDYFWYLVLCVLSCGTVYFLRVIISEGVKQAYEEAKN